MALNDSMVSITDYIFAVPKMIKAACYEYVKKIIHFWDSLPFYLRLSIILIVFGIALLILVRTYIAYKRDEVYKIKII